MVFILLLVSWELGERQSSIGLSPCQQGKGTEFGVPRARAKSWSKAFETLSCRRSLQGRKWWERRLSPRRAECRCPSPTPVHHSRAALASLTPHLGTLPPLPCFPLLLKVGSPVVMRPHLQWTNFGPRVGGEPLKGGSWGRDHGSPGPRRSSERFLVDSKEKANAWAGNTVFECPSGQGIKGKMVTRVLGLKQTVVLKLQEEFGIAWSCCFGNVPVMVMTITTRFRICSVPGTEQSPCQADTHPLPLNLGSDAPVTA